MLLPMLNSWGAGVKRAFDPKNNPPCLLGHTNKAIKDCKRYLHILGSLPFSLVDTNEADNHIINQCWIMLDAGNEELADFLLRRYALNQPLEQISQHYYINHTESLELHKQALDAITAIYVFGGLREHAQRQNIYEADQNARHQRHKRGMQILS